MPEELSCAYSLYKWNWGLSNPNFFWTTENSLGIVHRSKLTSKTLLFGLIADSAGITQVKTAWLTAVGDGVK